ncbi:flavin reductase family protein [Alteromonas confluentis]|uniref:Flavin oxidoreductase n=1 Tax=Alteromonas confluentis TaxID=1656094 RepID=A0A1E7Z8S3_9ALTE|nr:flavin reductase [Alteromonas confluentis]OFC69852.1 flavin oxidoreductase [Alteromonas confluentis]
MQHYTFDDLDQADKAFRTNFVNCLSGYKSANLVGTTDGKTHNLAIVSSAFHVGAHPPLMGILFRPDSVSRHSLENLTEAGEYTLNAVSADWTDKAHQTAARYDKAMSEFDAVGLTPEFIEPFPAPFVQESPLKIGLSVEEVTHLHCNKTILVVGRVQHVMIHPEAVGTDGQIALDALGLACVSGLDTYHQPQKIARYAYAKPERPLTRID